MTEKLINDKIKNLQIKLIKFTDNLHIHRNKIWVWKKLI